MKAYIQTAAQHQCSNANSYAAYDGFQQLGWETVFFRDAATIADNEPENVVVGNISDVHASLRKFNIEVPAPLDYPDSLQAFLGRKIWVSTMHAVAKETSFNVFIKPLHRSKSFTGKLISCERDLIGCYDYQSDMDILCAEPVHFLAEWRCFVRYSTILDVRRYRGDWRLHFDPAVIENALHSYHNAPKAFALDFGVTDKGETLLVEANDGYSLGAYGLPALDYAKLLSARWAELTGTRDYADF
ncbi:ATP-grasp domain-containing protein [Chitinophaga caseinilytica]|uniref:ATP-grasp domain-containing protein n=1 Tax=Chitinophaga caseinilytica TaxID=2267521 RepID=A0ABZ2YY87_9BACT